MHRVGEPQGVHAGGVCALAERLREIVADSVQRAHEASAKFLLAMMWVPLLLFVILSLPFFFFVNVASTSLLLWRLTKFLGTWGFFWLTSSVV